MLTQTRAANSQTVPAKAETAKLDFNTHKAIAPPNLIGVQFNKFYPKRSGRPFPRSNAISPPEHFR
jgi:hypothetical protein